MPAPFNNEKIVILFDGHCNLCTGWVRFIALHDPRHRFRFVPLQSEAGAIKLQEAGMAPEMPDWMIVLEGPRKSMRSEAVLRIFRAMRFPWLAMYALILVPPFIRDSVYRYVSRNRSRWFG